MTVFGTLSGTLSGQRSAAAELARLLDGATTTGSPSSSTVALAGVALRLQAAAPALAATAVPREEFRTALRTRLVAVASVQGVGASAAAVSPVRAAGLEAAVSWSRALRSRSAVGVAVGAMASAVVVAGVGVAGQQSLPGQPFYGVKRALEGVELRTADGALARGTTHLEHAGERLDEVGALARGRTAVALGPVGSGPVAGSSPAELVVETLEDMDADVRAAARLLTRASDAGTDPRPLQQLTGFAVRQDRELSALLPELPLVAQERAQASLALTDAVGGSAVALLLDGLPEPGAAVAPGGTGSGGTGSGTGSSTGTGTGLPGSPGVATQPGDPLSPGAPGSTTGSGGPAPAPSPGSTSADDGATPGAEQPADQPAGQPAPGAGPQPTATGRPSPRPALPGPGLPAPAPVSTQPVLPVPVPVPVPVPAPARPPLPAPVPDVPDLPAAPVPQVPDVPVVAPALPAVPQAPAPLAPVPAPLKPVTGPLLPGLLVAAPSPSPAPAPAPATVPSPAPGLAPSPR